MDDKTKQIAVIGVMAGLVTLGAIWFTRKAQRGFTGMGSFNPDGRCGGKSHKPCVRRGKVPAWKMKSTCPPTWKKTKDGRCKKGKRTWSKNAAWNNHFNR